VLLIDISVVIFNTYFPIGYNVIIIIRITIIIDRVQIFDVKFVIATYYILITTFGMHFFFLGIIRYNIIKKVIIT